MIGGNRVVTERVPGYARSSDWISAIQEVCQEPALQWRQASGAFPTLASALPSNNTTGTTTKKHPACA
ncbi:hypothetical protein CS8_038320 [Cupriavidus sp. 8B]